MKVLSVLLIVSIIKRASAGRNSPNIPKINWEIELVLAHEDCNKFYKYFQGKPLEVLCPKGLFFNIKYWQCDWKRYVNCSDDDDDEITNIADEESEDIDIDETDDDSEQEEVLSANLEFFQNGCPINPLINWLLPHEKDCNQFYYCLWGYKYKRHCPAFLHFNKKIQVCDWPGAAGCA